MNIKNVLGFVSPLHGKFFRKIVLSSLAATLVVSGFFISTPQVFAATATNLSVTSHTVPYSGGSFSLTATLSPAMSGKTISFYLISPAITGITTALTDVNGVAVVQGMNAASINAGDYPTGINATFAGDANYTTSSATADLTITKIDQTIQVFGALSDKIYGDPDFSFGAFSGSGLPVVFSASTPDVCTISGFTAHIVGVGDCTIIASQAGNANYNPAPDISKTLTIDPMPVILSGSRPYDGTTIITAGILSILNKVGNDEVNVVSGSGDVSDASFLGGQSLISLGDLTLGGANANHYTLTGATSYVHINKATTTISITNSPTTYTGSPQSAIITSSVPGVVSNVLYDFSSTEPTDVGSYSVTADFSPTDSTNYNSLIGASAGNFVITARAPLTISSVDVIDDINVVNGTDLGNVVLPATVGVTLSDSSTSTPAIVWDSGTPTYDGNTSGTYAFTGALTLTSGVTNPTNLTATVNVIVATPVTLTSPVAATPPTQNDPVVTASPLSRGGGGGGRGGSYIAPVISKTTRAVIPGCGVRTTGFSITTGQSCVGNIGTVGSTVGQVLGAQSFHFTLTLKIGSKGNEVVELQKFLATAGYYSSVVDGKFGVKVKTAVIKFEIANKLKGDGVVGPKVRALLNA